MKTKTNEYISAYHDVKNGMNVSIACNRWGLSQATYYKYNQRRKSYGLDGIQPRSRRPHKLRSYDQEIRNKVKHIIIGNPTYSLQKIRDKLQSDYKLKASRSGIRKHLISLKLNLDTDKLKFIFEKYRGKSDKLNEVQLNFISKYHPPILDHKILERCKELFVQFKIIRLKDTDGNIHLVYLCIDAKSKYAVTFAMQNENALYFINALKRLYRHMKTNVCEISFDARDQLKQEFTELLIQHDNVHMLTSSLNEKIDGAEFYTLGGAANHFEKNIKNDFKNKTFKRQDMANAVNEFTDKHNNEAILK